ncbi:MAG: hypothetical protein RLZZ165_457 [Bacteroidota bacterium]
MLLFLCSSDWNSMNIPFFLYLDKIDGNVNHIMLSEERGLE